MKIKVTNAGLNAFILEPERLSDAFPLTCLLMAGRFEEFKNKNKAVIAEFNEEMQQLEDDYCVKDANGVVQTQVGVNGKVEPVFRDAEMHREFDEKMKAFMEKTCIVIV